MKVKNIVRKAVALGSGAALVGTTLMGAFAYDLSTYPAKYIVDGKFDGKIVVGEKAATADVLGSIDIAASLQGASVSKVAAPGVAGQVSLSGDSYKLETSSDALELREFVGDVVDTVTESNLAGLKGGNIVTSEGDTDYFQYLRLKDANNLQNMSVNYLKEGENDVTGDFLIVDTGEPFIEWEIQFPDGLESEVDSGELTDLEDRSFNIMGTDFTIVKADISSGNTNVELTLMGGSVPDTLREGETKTYTINGVDYEVTLVFVSDPNTGTPEVKFSVNGEITQSLQEGDTDTLSGGLQIGVRDILVNSREGVASFFLGADKVVFSDSSATTANTFNGDVEINNENINDGEVSILGANVSSSNFEITSIKYRLTMDAAQGTTAYIPKGHGIKENMKKPESLISDSLDIKYEGLTMPKRTDVSFKSSGDDAYDMTFTNILGQEYTFTVVSNQNGVFKFGEDTDDLVLIEAASTSTYNIGPDDYFVVSNDRGASDADKSVTNVLQYTDYDDDARTLEFEDVGTGSTHTVSVASDGTGSLVIGGHSYTVNVSSISAAEPNLYIDLNADGGAGDAVTITSWGGLVINPAAYLTNATNSSSHPALSAVNGDGKTLGTDASSGSGAVVMTATISSDRFDTTGTDETFNWTISQDDDQVDLDFNSNSYVGPLANGLFGDIDSFDFQDLENDDDHQVGMTDYGILIDEYNPSGSNSDPNELTLSVPEQQATAQVFMTLGSVTASEGSAGSMDKVNPIAVGIAVLDKDAPAIGSENLIIVGGPCANTVAAAALGNPASCGEGFEPGKAMIKSWDKNGKVAILVAGYEATETLGASRVLAAYKDYALKGAEVEVVVADLNSIKVQAPTMAMSDNTTA